MVFALFISKNIAPSKVPAGQMYLQKPGSGSPFSWNALISGRPITKTNNNTYLKYDKHLVILLFLTFGVLILYNNSCKSPTGHKNPQIVRPKIIQYNNIIPKTYVGSFVLLSAKAFWIEPSGQAPIAPGHE